MIYGNRFYNRANLDVLGWMVLACIWMFFYPHPYISPNLHFSPERLHQDDLDHYYYQFKLVVIVSSALIFILKLYWASKKTYYFELDDDHFNIKNYLRPGLNRVTKLSDIEKINIRESFGGDRELHLILNGQQPIIYDQSILNNRHWKHLIADFEARGFKVNYTDVAERTILAV